jgi:hypothetical protein
MAKLIDQPGVADLVAKHVDKALKTQTAASIKAAKTVTAQHVEFHATAGAKDMVKAAKLHGSAIVEALKAPTLA